eukprot:CAMPEP_0172380928 /NCGR_PEP_ID=MMETSP1060-20121228/70688_1 /TAXON_ID=37318 /ORGANISM="Pseudo-nitzschia pungens, Strain cf. cingulata" /LENGTH=229 /DNA_ID=CAMNT_0013108695 /DNA_START=627 /DNA_END=1316 /DNA_ORIENTATION=-
MSFPGQSLQRAWHLVDAKNQTVGRLAGQISQILKGKHKPTFRPNKDMGDHVVVINAEKVQFSGKKWNDKLYRWHTGYPGGLKERTAKDMMAPQAGGGPEKSDTGHAQAQQFAAPIDRTEAEDLFRTGTPAHGAAAASDDRSAPAASPGQDRGLSLRAEAVQFTEDDRNGEEGKQIKPQVTQQQQQNSYNNNSIIVSKSICVFVRLDSDLEELELRLVSVSMDLRSKMCV